MDFLSAPSNFLVQWFRNFDSKDLGSLDLGMWFRRSAHWGGFFSARASKIVLREKLLEKSGVFQGHLQPIAFEDFVGIIEAKRDTAPGPDGVVYRFLLSHF